LAFLPIEVREETVVTDTEVREEIDRINRRFEGAFERGDMADLAALYTQDAKVLPPDAAMVSGRIAIQQFWQTARESMGIQSVRLSTQDLEVSGDHAYEIGVATLSRAFSSATMKYVLVWRSEAEGWRAAVGIWNSNPVDEAFLPPQVPVWR
jgi:ketosteroid isomerase-like protein